MGGSMGNRDPGTFRDRVVAVISGLRSGEVVSYGDVAAEGVGPQDRIAILDKNGTAFFDAIFGAAKINAVLVAINWRLAPQEMAYVINDAEARVLLVGPDFAQMVAGLQDQLTSVKCVVHVDSHSYGGWLDGRSSEDPGVE